MLDQDEVTEVLARYQKNIATAVANGVRWMDLHAERDWRRRIDLESLNIASAHTDPLGQVYGCYWGASHRMNITSREAVNLGMYVPSILVDVLSMGLEVDVYADLTARWRYVLS